MLPPVVPNMNRGAVKECNSKDVTLSTESQCGCKFVGDGKRFPTVDSHRKIMVSNCLLAQDRKRQVYYTRKLQQNVNIITFMHIKCKH
jgi:hypothetical protein